MIVIAEILDRINRTKGIDNRKAELEKHFADKALASLFKMNFDDNLQHGMPEGAPPYKEPDEKTGRYKSLKFQQPILPRLYQKNRFDVVRRERMFKELLETSHPEDAKLLIACKDKNMNSIYKNITKKLIKSIWPDLF